MTLDWLSILGIVLSSGLLAYGLIWMLRSWNRRLIVQANRTLRLPISPFLLKPRKQIIEELMIDPQLQQNLHRQSEETGIPVPQLEARCRRYAGEIVPSFKAVFYFRFGYWLARCLLLSLYRVHSQIVDMAAFDAIRADSSILLVLNHRSNMDVLLVNYLASRHSTLMHAAGEWARLWPLYHLLRLAGNCVVDRDASDPLYRALMKDYIQMAVRGRASLAIFPEGELSRDGRLQQAKFGLLSYAVTAERADQGHPIYLIPVGINFDRIPEETNLITDTSVAYRTRSRLRIFLSAVWATLSLSCRVLAPRNAQFGNACATFGLPLSLHDWQAARAVDSASEAATRQWVAELGDELMQRVARAIPVLPTHVLATIFATDPERAWPETNLRQRASELVAEFRDNGAVICLPGADEQSAFADTLRQFVQRKLVSRDPRARLSADPARIPLLRYLANSVEHLRPSA